MKKILSLTIIALIALIGLSVSVNAAEVVSDEAGLRAQLEAGNSVELGGDILGITGESTNTTTTSRKVGIAIKGEGTITIDGKGHKISTETLDVLFEIYTSSSLTVEFKDIEIVGVLRAIDTRKPGITLKLNKADIGITCISGKDNQPITIGGPSGRVKVDIKDSKIDAGEYGYGIVVFNPVDMTIENSTIEGYSCLYFKDKVSSEGSNGSIVKVQKSELNGSNKFSGTSDSFGTVIFEDGGVSLEIIDSKINAQSTGSAAQFALAESTLGTSGGNFTAPNKINISGETIVNAKDDAIIVLPNHSEDAKPQITIGAGVKSNKDLTEYLPEGVIAEYDGNGNYIVKVKLDKPTNLKWDGTIAKWDADPNADMFGLMIYNEDDFVSGFIKIEGRTSFDCAEYLTDDEKSYYFTVEAYSNDSHYTKSDVATSEIYKFPVEEPSGDDKGTTEQQPTAGGQGTAEKEPAKDETPKTGAFDIALYILGAIALVSVVGTVKAKKPGKYSK